MKSTQNRALTLRAGNKGMSDHPPPPKYFSNVGKHNSWYSNIQHRKKTQVYRSLYLR